MPLPALYVRMYERGVFTAEEAAEASDLRGRALHRALAHLREAGYVQQVRRGLFAIVPTADLGKEDVETQVNRYVLASKLADPYALAYHTALELHGVAHSVYDTVHVATPRQFRSFEHQGVAYKRVLASKREMAQGVTTHKIEGEPVHVMEREWTLVQCALRLELSGGFEEFYRSVSGFASLRPQVVLEAIRTYGARTLYNRVGLVLWANREKWHVDDAQLDAFREHVSEHPYYFGARKGRAKFVREWNVFVPEPMAQEFQHGA